MLTREPLGVLIVDDSERDFRSTRDLFVRSSDTAFDVQWAPSYREGLAAMVAGESDVCLVDYDLEGTSGLALVEEAQRRGARVPTILLSGHRGEAFGAMSHPAVDDCLPKWHLSTALLERTVRHAIERRRLLQRAEDAERQVASLASTLRDVERKMAATTRFETLGRLVGGVAHDFNNMLTAIVCEAEQLKRSLDRGDPSHSGAQEIIRSSIRAAELTRQLLTFGRPRTFEVQQLELNAVVEGMERMLQRLLGHGARLETALCDDATVVEGELCQLERVVVNLVVNARDAMPAGGRVLVETHVEERRDERGLPQGECVVLTVSDQGTGMTEDVRARLFEPFFTTKRPDEGAGLGLSSVREIVERAGGTIEVYSEPGAGSRFAVFLPRAGRALSGDT